MEGHTLEEAAHKLTPSADYFRNTLEQLRHEVLFSGKADPILKPCVFFSESVSMRLIHRNANIYVKEAGIEHTMISAHSLPAVPAEAARQQRVNRHWPEDALTPCTYPQVVRRGLFELSFYPEHIDMTETKESGRVQLYRKKAIQAKLTDSAVLGIMNNFSTLHPSQVPEAKARIRQDVGDMVILSQEGFHYLVDASVSIPLADIRITDKMLADYAANKGIKLPPKVAPAPIIDQAAKQATIDFDFQDILPVRFIAFYTGGKLGPECTALFFAHKQGIDWNRRMAPEDKLTAYHWQYGKSTAIKRTEWESVVHSIQSLSERYNKTERHFDEWRTAALKLLPVAFVWRSEFDAAYQRAMSPERITFVDQSRGFSRLTGDEDKEARQTIEMPYIPPELVDIVFEGFDASLTTSHGIPAQKREDDPGQTESPEEQAVNATKKQKRDKPKTPSTKDSRLATSTFMDDALCEYFAKYGKDPNSFDILIETVKVGTRNRDGDEKYEVINIRESPDRFLTLRTKMGLEYFSYKQVKKSYDYRLRKKYYRTLPPRTSPRYNP